MLSLDGWKMTDRRVLADQNETPEDVATLYSWANLHGAKYRDFSASRAQMREKARQRVQDAVEEDRRRTQEEADESRLAEARQAAESERGADQKAAEAARIAAEEAAREAARAVAETPASDPRAWQQPEPVSAYAAPIPAPLPTGLAPSGPCYVPPAPRFAPASVPYAYPVQPQQPAFTSYMQPSAYRSAPAPAQYPTVREDQYGPSRKPWNPVESRESLGRPAWLAIEHEPAVAQPAPSAPDDTIQGSRERLADRWFALKSVFHGAETPADAAPAPVSSSESTPVLAVFSLAGGVGKTSLVATLGRALSGCGERVLLVDTAPFGLLPFFFGARDQRPGQLRTFTPPGTSTDAPIQLVALDPDSFGQDKAAQERITAEISGLSRGANRVLVDLATASGATTRRVLRLNPTVLVPVVPDMNSVVSVSSIDSFFQRNGGGHQTMPYYVLNQFDPSLPLHLDVREVLREQLGDRLLPFALRRTPAFSEALAEGMTAMDYAPNSTVAEDFSNLAGWVKSLAAPASAGFRGVRWSER